MSGAALKYATGILNSDIKLTPTAQSILRELAWRHNLTEEKRVSMAALANDLGKKKRNIARAIKELLQADVIRVLPEPNKPQRTPQLYQFCAPFDLNGSGQEYVAGMKAARKRTEKSAAKSPHLMRSTDATTKPRPEPSDDGWSDRIGHANGAKGAPSEAEANAHLDEDWASRMNGDWG
jgi:hypothetical protein